MENWPFFSNSLTGWNSILSFSVWADYFFHVHHISTLVRCYIIFSMDDYSMLHVRTPEGETLMVSPISLGAVEEVKDKGGAES